MKQLKNTSDVRRVKLARRVSPSEEAKAPTWACEAEP